MNWNEIINHPSLQDLPFKIETNEWRQIVMSPITNKRGCLQSKIGFLMTNLIGDGFVSMKSCIETGKGVKVADVAWISSEFVAANDFETPYRKSPEVCVEIVSPSNSKREMTEKRKLYFERGAKEVWLCCESGRIEFYDSQGLIEQSSLFPTFPAEIKISW